MWCPAEQLVQLESEEQELQLGSVRMQPVQSPAWGIKPEIQSVQIDPDEQAKQLLKLDEHIEHAPLSTK